MFKLEKISTIVAVATSLIAADLAGSSHIVNAENFRSQNYQPQYSQTTGVQNQNWAQGLFEAKDYNFGTVARAAKAEHVFSFKNEGDQPIEIMSVSVSCTCTKPEILTRWWPRGKRVELRLNSKPRNLSDNAVLRSTYP